MAIRRIETKASRTAAYTCFSRACATREKDPRFRGPDTLAEVILPPIPRFTLEFAPARKFLMHKMFPAGIYEYVCARTKVMDAAFLEALEARFAQIVLLGAGFDTRALRFGVCNHGTKIFELDAPTTQEPKLEIFRKKGLIPPPELVFVSINFNQEDIFEVLTRAGYQDGQKTFFLWEGVCMYLNTQAVDNTLAFIQKHAARGSRIIFDYIYASVLRQENRYYGEQDIYKTVANAGESWTFGLEEGEVEPFLAERGFELLAHYTPVELEKLFLSTEDGALHGRVNGTHCIVLAAVKNDNEATCHPER
jgi:methyltransferase (TIGR00027 family)